MIKTLRKLGTKGNFQHDKWHLGKLTANIPNGERLKTLPKSSSNMRMSTPPVLFNTVLEVLIQID